MPRAVVTGGAGFLGSHLCERLLTDGYEVICVDNFLTGSKENLASLENEVGFDLLNHDATQPLDIPGPLDAVLHLASPASPVDYGRYPIETLRAGAMGTEATLELAHAKNARYLFASSSEVYGDPQVNPQPEEYTGNVNHLGPRGVYDEAKRFGETMTAAYSRTLGVDTSIARIFNSYGPGMKKDDGRVIPNFISQALQAVPLTVYGDGQQTRSFCYVDDVIEGLIRLLKSSIREPINLGNPHELTILELARKVGELVGVEAKVDFKPLPADDPQMRRPDITKAEKMLAWRPKTSLEEGLLRTIKDFRGRES